MMEPLVLRLPKEDKEFLEDEAKRKKQSVAAVVRRAIKRYRSSQPKRKSGAQVLLDWMKKHPAITDPKKQENISGNYKQYLYGPKSPKFGHYWRKK